MSVVSQLKQDAYTGENRCEPCTIVNVTIAVGISIVLAFVSEPLSVVVFTLSLGTIYLRGFLIPGTPKLMKRYFPDRVLQWFDKEAPQSPQTKSTKEQADF